ncbi:hypothetical protein C2845_PM07G09320 [Panicum miliaceum]|uniref:Uncharacterized protein n=1 Tax=Panicum miliaceum TaxID=4540 RepID=A0A3L6SNH7_PANMI|nr:hypothetical protein C2845_PM07G09320 [Panicum miliaceum]
MEASIADHGKQKDGDQTTNGRAPQQRQRQQQIKGRPLCGRGGAAGPVRADEPVPRRRRTEEGGCSQRQATEQAQQDVRCGGGHLSLN